jgi:hypothetical protein
MAGVLAATDDLFFGAKIAETAARLNVPLALVRSAFTAQLPEILRPYAVI